MIRLQKTVCMFVAVSAIFANRSDASPRFGSFRATIVCNASVPIVLVPKATVSIVLVPKTTVPIALVQEAASVDAEDVVVVRGSNPDNSVKYKGTIVGWSGNRLVISSRGRDREFENEDILDVKTAWGNDFDSARLLAGQGQFAPAIERFQAALQTETRQWARAIINAELVQAYSATDDHGKAIETFGQILADDPETRFMYLTPLPWTGTVSGAGLTSQAEMWIDTNQPVVQLIGASWLLTGPRNADATMRLEQLALGDNPQIAALATAQLWRTVMTQADETRVSRWQEQINQMPQAMRAGPLYLLGTARGQLNQTDEAVLNLMQIRILYPQQQALGAAALYKSASLLQNAGQTEQAKIIQRELLAAFPDSVWAGQIDPRALNQ